MTTMPSANIMPYAMTVPGSDAGAWFVLAPGGPWLLGDCELSAGMHASEVNNANWWRAFRSAADAAPIYNATVAGWPHEPRARAGVIDIAEFRRHVVRAATNWRAFEYVYRLHHPDVMQGRQLADLARRMVFGQAEEVIRKYEGGAP